MPKLGLGLWLVVEVILMSFRSNQQIVDQTNALARRMAEASNWEAPEGYRFWLPSSSGNPRGLLYWQLACIAQEELTDTDAENALAELEDDGNGV
jgi:hypothetical protein